LHLILQCLPGTSVPQERHGGVVDPVEVSATICLPGTPCHVDEVVLGTQDPSVGSLADDDPIGGLLKQFLREPPEVAFEDPEEDVCYQFFQSTAVVDAVAGDDEGVERHSLGEDQVPRPGNVEVVDVPLVEEVGISDTRARVEGGEVDLGFDFGGDAESH